MNTAQLSIQQYIRAKDGKPLKFAFQTSINAPRQKNQAVIKQACQKAGIDVELKSVVASVYFSSDTANPDTYAHFYCDAEMFTTNMGQPDPQRFLGVDGARRQEHIERPLGADDAGEKPGDRMLGRQPATGERGRHPRR